MVEAYQLVNAKSLEYIPMCFPSLIYHISYEQHPLC